MTARQNDDTTASWHDFLSQQGAVWHDGHLRGFNSTVPDRQPWLIPMEHQSLLTVCGPDAEKFLQGQVTCDIRKLAERQILAGAHCDPKGRMQSSFVIARLDEETVGLRLHSSIVDTARAALQKYIVFSKAELTVASGVHMLALTGAGVEEAANYFPLDIPPQHHFTQGEGFTILRHSHTHLEIWVHSSQAKAVWQYLAPHCTPAAPEQWDLAQIELGVGEVRAPIAGEFLPQMLNLEQLGGISFDKGCYTGQEVVARMHYLGKAKKHMYRAQVATAERPEAGTPLFKIGSDSSIGQVVMGAHISPDEVALLVVCSDGAYPDNIVALGSPSGPQLQWQPLPYSLD